MRLFIPPLGTVLVLTQDWTFRLFLESRNQELLSVFAGLKKPKGSRWSSSAGNELYYQLVWCWHRDDKSGSPLDQHMSKVGYPLVHPPEIDPALTKNMYKTVREHTDPVHIVATLPANTQLKVDRIYIRQGIEAFNSVSFRIDKVSPIGGGKRFWAKLHDANQIECECI